MLQISPIRQTQSRQPSLFVQAPTQNFAPVASMVPPQDTIRFAARKPTYTIVNFPGDPEGYTPPVKVQPPLEDYAKMIGGHPDYYRLCEVPAEKTGFGHPWGFLHRPDAVHGIPLVKDAFGRDCIALMFQEKPALGGCTVIGLAGGLVDEGHSAEQQVVQEMHEETGMTVTKVHPALSTPWVTSCGFTDERKSFIPVSLQGTLSRDHQEPAEKVSIKGLLYLPVSVLMNRKRFSEWVSDMSTQGYSVGLDVLAAKALLDPKLLKTASAKTPLSTVKAPLPSLKERIEFLKHVEALVQDIHYKEGFRFTVRVDNPRNPKKIEVGPEHMAPDRTIPGSPFEWRRDPRKLEISFKYKDDQIVQTALGTLKMLTEHEIRESLRVDQKLIFNPHRDQSGFQAFVQANQEEHRFEQDDKHSTVQSVQALLDRVSFQGFGLKVVTMSPVDGVSDRVTMALAFVKKPNQEPEVPEYLGKRITYTTGNSTSRILKNLLRALIEEEHKEIEDRFEIHGVRPYSNDGVLVSALLAFEKPLKPAE
jgi:hypothetical protein